MCARLRTDAIDNLTPGQFALAAIAQVLSEAGAQIELTDARVKQGQNQVTIFGFQIDGLLVTTCGCLSWEEAGALRLSGTEAFQVLPSPFRYQYSWQKNTNHDRQEQVDAFKSQILDILDHALLSACVPPAPGVAHKVPRL